METNLECHPSEVSSSPSPTLSDADHINDQGQAVEESKTDDVSDSDTEVIDAALTLCMLSQGNFRQCDSTGNVDEEQRILEAEIPDPSRPRGAPSDGVQLIVSRDEQELRNQALVRENEVLNNKIKVLSGHLLALAARDERLIKQQVFVNRAPLMQNEALAANMSSL